MPGFRRSSRISRLSEHEHTLLDLIGEGLTNRQIAERMFLGGMPSRVAVQVLSVLVAVAAVVVLRLAGGWTSFPLPLRHHH